MAKVNPQGMKTNYKSRVVHGTWVGTDEKKKKLNIMSNEDRERLGLPIDNQLDEPQQE